MLDRELAKLYDVTTAALNQAVRRNRERFPEDFMFQLTSEEVAQLNRSQIVIGSEKHRDPSLRPYIFTEQGVAMPKIVNIEIMPRRKPSTIRVLPQNSCCLYELDASTRSPFNVIFAPIRH